MITFSILVKCIWACCMLAAWYGVSTFCVTRIELLQLDFTRSELSCLIRQLAWLLAATSATAGTVVGFLYLFHFL